MLEIVYKPIKQIKRYDNNPRCNADAVEAVAKSIEQFGWLQPIVIDRNEIIVAGDTRYQAGELLGCETVPCVYADKLTEDQIKAYRLIDNKTSEFSHWDYDKLQVEINEIEIDLSDFNLCSKDINLKDFFTDKDDIAKDEDNEKAVCPTCGRPMKQ